MIKRQSRCCSDDDYQKHDQDCCSNDYDDQELDQECWTFARNEKGTTYMRLQTAP
jgi:hypothetical protein